jgi:uncharacterized DUF497 family protein
MKLSYDLAKNARNIELRQLSFERAADFDWGSAIRKEDDRKIYPEKRYIALGYLGNRLHIICYAETRLGIRVISFRKANERDKKNYEEVRAANR